MVFWHIYPVIFCYFPFLFYKEPLVYALLGAFIWSIFVILLIVTPIMSEGPAFLDLKIGITGVFISNLIILVSVNTKSIPVLNVITLLLFNLTVPAMFMFLIVSSSYYSRRYIQLPYESMPYAKIHVYVIVIGTIHMLVAALSYMVLENWMESIALIIASFFFSVDTYCVWKTESYYLVEHYHYKWEGPPKLEDLKRIDVQPGFKDLEMNVASSSPI